MGEGAGGRRASTVPCGLDRLAEAVGDRAHSGMDHAQPQDEPRLRVLGRDDGYEFLAETTEALIYVAMIRLMLTRHAKAAS